MLARLAPDDSRGGDEKNDTREAVAGRTLQRLAPLVHPLSNQLQHAVGEADLLAEKARARNVPFDLRQDLATLLDRLDSVVRTVQQVQTTLGDGTGGELPVRARGTGR